MKNFLILNYAVITAVTVRLPLPIHSLLWNLGQLGSFGEESYPVNS